VSYRIVSCTHKWGQNTCDAIQGCPLQVYTTDQNIADHFNTGNVS